MKIWTREAKWQVWEPSIPLVRLTYKVHLLIMSLEDNYFLHLNNNHRFTTMLVKAWWPKVEDKSSKCILNKAAQTSILWMLSNIKCLHLIILLVQILTLWIVLVDYWACVLKIPSNTQSTTKLKLLHQSKSLSVLEWANNNYSRSLIRLPLEAVCIMEELFLLVHLNQAYQNKFWQKEGH